jgi:hypothetical protein
MNFDRYRAEIEALVKRPMRDVELAKVPGLGDLTVDHKIIVYFLVEHRAILCALYLLHVCTNRPPTISDIKEYMEDLVAERKQNQKKLDELFALTEALGLYDEPPCQVDMLSSSACARGTKSCNVKHEDE